MPKLSVGDHVRVKEFVATVEYVYRDGAARLAYKGSNIGTTVKFDYEKIEPPVQETKDFVSLSLEQLENAPENTALLSSYQEIWVKRGSSWYSRNQERVSARLTAAYRVLYVPVESE